LLALTHAPADTKTVDPKIIARLLHDALIAPTYNPTLKTSFITVTDAGRRLSAEVTSDAKTTRAS
jgi:hypothetical protein